MRYVRIRLDPTIDNQAEPPIWIDAVLGEDNRIIGNHAIFGILGDFDTRDVQFEPFVLDSKGQTDWGTGFDQPANERYGMLDIRDYPVIEGQLLTSSSPNYRSCRYRITRIVTLPAGS